MFEWPKGREKRHCSELYQDAHGVLWGVATFDPGSDNGPFDSYLYEIEKADSLFESVGKVEIDSSETRLPALKLRWYPVLYIPVTV